MAPWPVIVPLTSHGLCNVKEPKNTTFHGNDAEEAMKRPSGTDNLLSSCKAHVDCARIQDSDRMYVICTLTYEEFIHDCKSSN